jgi:hypothetical protein
VIRLSRLARLSAAVLSAWLPVVLLIGSAAPVHAQSAPAQPRVLGRDDILLYGLGVKVEPGYQTVPKDIATIVSTFLQAPNSPSGLPPFAPDAEVVATLRGPSFPAPVELHVKPNTPFNIPPLTVPGVHVLENIRLISGGDVLLRATPDHVTIDVIEKLLVTQVTARPLTAAEIRERNIVFDASNFQAYNFSAAFAIADQPITLNFPVVLPRLAGAGDVSTPTTTIPSIPGPMLPSLSTIIPDTLKLQTKIPNLSVVGFTLKVPSLSGQNFVVPPIPGVVVIPGDIGFLNQYFSVMLMVGNVAPGGSNLVVTNLKAEIVLPAGNDNVAGSPDDPLRMAQTTSGESPRLRTVAQPGPDGKVGTADDIPSLGPGESGNAEYLVEGRREGSHVVEMRITGTLNGLPIGPVTVTGSAAGSVLVRNPNFTLTFTHPEVVSAGEPYTLDVTVTNTSTAPANFVSVNLYPRNVSGATIVGDPSRTIESLPPGDSTTLSFNLISKKSGKVTAATLDSDENVAGRFALKSAVGELGVPLSPDSLVLPKEANALKVPGDNPDDLKQAALGLLGKAHAVATAPAAALPADVRRFSRKIVIDRAIQVAEAGLRVSMGEPVPTSASQLLMDFMGSDAARLAALFPGADDQAFEKDNFEGFDELRRRSIRGDQFAAAVGRVLAPDLAAKGAQVFLNGLATAWSYRPGHVAVLVSGNGQPLPARFSLVDAQNRRAGAAGADGKIVKEIPFSDVVDVSNASGEVIARLIVVAAPQPGTFNVAAETSAGAPANAGYVVSVVSPDANGGLRQVTSPVLTFPQRPATIGGAGDPFVVTFGAFGGDEIVPASSVQVVDPGPTVISVIQQASADVLRCEEEDPGVPVGRVVAVLFSEEVTPASVQDRLAAADITNYQVEGNRVVGVALQPGRRIAFLALRDPYGPFVARQITISQVKDMRGHDMQPWSGPIQATVPDTGGVVSGRVLNADGTPVPFANLRLFSMLACEAGDPQWVGISSKAADADGKYQFDYVTRLLGDRLLAVNQETGENRNVRFNVQRNGQRLNVDIVFLGRGTFSGGTFDERGHPLSGTSLRVSSLTDGSQYGATTDVSGHFTIPGVPVGNFFVEAVNVTAHAQFSFSEYLPAASVTIARDITLLDVATRTVTVKHGALSGHVLRFDGVTPAPAVPVIVWYQHLSQPGVSCPGDPAPIECAIAMMNTDAQGGFAFADLTAGELRLQTFDQGALSQGQARLVLAADASTETNVLLSGGLGTVNGIVLDAAQQPVAGARVGGGLSLTTTDSEGKFTLTDVPVGKYPIVAVSDALGSRGQVTVDIVQPGQVVNAAITLAAVGTISGNVVQADGLTPVANVDVYVFTRDAGAVAVVGTGKTNANGGFSITSIPAGSYQVSAFNSGFTDGNIVPATVKFQGQTFRTTIRFRGTGGRITGKVFDDDGVTPLKARVAVSGDQLVVAGNKVGVEFKQVNYFQVVDTDFSTGAFAFNNLLVGPVTVSAIGQFSPDPISVETTIPAPNAVVTVDLKLQATSQIKGVVLLPNGVQPAGANVVVKYKSDAFKVICTESGGDTSCESIPQGIQEANVVTDGQGRFWLPVVNAGTFTLTVEDPATGKVGTIKGNVKPGEVANLSVRLFGTGDVTLKVLGSDATTPIAGAHVDVQQLGYPQKRLTFTADNTGTVLLTGGDALAEGAFVVTATDPSNGFSGRAQGRVVSDGEQVLVKVFLYNAAGTIAGTVFGPDGFTPIPNAEVIVSGAGGPLAFSVTGGDGHYSVGTVPVGAVSVEIFEARTGRRGAASGRVDADGQQVTIDVVEAAIGMVKGQVLQQATLDPLKGWTVTLRQQSPSGLSLPTLQTTTGVDGAYSFPGASRGTFDVAASYSDVQAHGSARGAIEREGQVVEVPVLVNIVRQLTGGISGVVLNASGAPLGNVALEFCLPNRCAASGNLQITSAGDGTFVVNDVALGRFSVTAHAQTGGDAGSAVGELSFDGDVATVTVIMNGLAKITGQVVKADGSPAGNVQVSLKAYPTSGCTDECSQSADGAGNFTFLNIPGRTFTVTAADPFTGLKGVAGGSLNPGEQKTLRIVLEPTTTVSGRVLTSAGTPANGAVAEMIVNPNGGANERRLYRETGLDGTFDFAAVPLTPYVLQLSDPVGAGVATRQGTLVGPLNVGDVILDEAPPQVASLSPGAGSRGAAVTANVIVTFTEPILRGTVDADSVTLIGPDGPVLATRDFTTNDTVVVLDPIASLKDETTYTVRVSGVKDRVQKAMPSAYVASFTTLDVTRPTIAEASPAASVSGVTIYTPIRIKFSEAIDTTKFSGAAIALSGPGGPVAGALSFLFGNTVAVFTPNLPLAEDTTYQVTVRKATDLSGLAQSADTTYSFKTTSRIPPTLASLVAANDGQVIEGGVGLVTATPSPTSDVLFVDFYVNGTLAGTDRIAPFQFAFQATPQLGAPGATVTVTAIPTDTSGNRGLVPGTAQLTIVADQPPALTLGVTTPSGTLSAKNGDRIVVSVHGSDDLGLTQLGYRAATGNPVDALTRFYAPAKADKVESFAFNVPASAAPGSTIAVQASAIDTKGQVSQATPIDVTVVDAVQPVVEITGATTGATLRPGQSTTVLVTANDLGGVSQVTFTAGGLVTRSDARAIDPAQNAVVTSFTVTVPGTARPGQTLTLDATATDRAGNTGTAARVILPIADTIAPTVTVQTANGSLGVAPGQIVNVVVNGEDEGLLSELRLAATGAMTFNQAKQVTPPSGSATLSFEVIVPAALPTGAQIQLAATAVDLSGNVSAPASVTLTVSSGLDVTLPASQIVKAGKTVNVTVQLGQPAPANGLRLDFAIDNPDLAAVTPSLVFAAGETSRTIQLTGVAGGTTTLRALYQSVARASMTVSVSGGVVSGTVLDSQLHPVAGAQLTVSGGGVSVSATSAADGTYVAEGLPGPNVAVKAIDPVTRLRGYATGTMNAPSGTLNLSVVLIPAGAVEGGVFQADGTTPAGPNVRVDIFEAGRGTALATVFTDAQSHYEFPLVTLGQYTLQASATDGSRGSSALTLVESGQEVTLPIVYLGYGTLQGTVFNGSGAAVPNAALTLRTWDVFGGSTPIVTNADGFGKFLFTHVNVGSFSLDAKDLGTGQAGSIAGSVVNHQQVLTRNITIASFGSVHGTVFRAGGTIPVAGAQVFADGRLATTNESGQYRFDILPLGTYALRASEAGTRSVGAASASIAANGQDVLANITLADQGRLLVTVRDANGAIVPSAFIEVGVDAGAFSDTLRATAGADGTALIEHVLVGTATVTASSGALAGRLDNVAVTAGAPISVTVSLEPTGSVTGTVYQPDGQTPVSGGSVRIGDSYPSRVAPIGADGVYKYDLLPKGNYSLAMSDANGKVRAFTKTDVKIETNGQVVVRDFTMVGLANVKGRVVFSNGNSAQSFGVTLRSLNPDFGGVSGTATDGGGNYLFTGVPVGPFTVSSGDSAQQLLGEASGAITLHGKDETADIVLQNNAITLPQFYWDGNNYDFMILRDGQIATGSAFGATSQGGGQSGGASLLELVANGTSQAFDGDPISTVEDGGREVATRQANLQGLSVTRKIAVPRDGYFSRELELLTNPGTAPITVDVRLTSRLRSLQSGQVPAAIIATSSGDTTFTAGDAGDRWLVVGEGRPSSGTVIPARAFVVGGGGTQPLGTASVADADPVRLTYGWTSITVQPGQTVGLLHFVVLQTSNSAAQAAAERLVQLPPEALQGLSPEEIGEIVNFTMPADGHSAVAPLPALNGTINGQVFDSGDATPTPTVQPRVILETSSVLYHRAFSVTAGADGRFSITSLTNDGAKRLIPLVPYTLRAEQPKTGVLSPDVASDFAPGNTVATSDIVFTNTGVIGGSVKRVNGDAAPAGTVEISGGSFAKFSVSIGNGARFRIGGLPPGTYTLKASIPVAQGGSNLTATGQATVVAGATTPVELPLPQTYSVSGTVFRASNVGAPGVRIELRSGSAAFSRVLTTSTGGTFSFADVPAGSYVLEATEPRTLMTTTAAVVVTDAPATKNLTLIAVGSVTGTITLKGGGAAIDETVTLNYTLASGAHGATTTQTNGSGIYQFSDVPASTFTLEVNDTFNHLYGTAGGQLQSDGENVTVDFVLDVNTVNLPLDLYDANGFRYPIDRNSITGNPGPFSNGTSYLQVNGGGYIDTFDGGQVGVRELGGRQVKLTGKIGAIDITRKIYVPQRGYFTRFVETFHNSTSQPVPLEFYAVDQLSSPWNAPVVQQTSSGDTIVSATGDAATVDRWAYFDDYFDADPFTATNQIGPVGMLWAGPGGTMLPDNLDVRVLPNWSLTGFTQRWSGWTLQPGETVSVMHFLVPQTTRAAAQASLDRLSQLPNEAIEGLTDEDRASIRNFVVPAPGSSTLPPLPGLEGHVDGHVYGAIGDTPVSNALVQAQSLDPIFARTYQMLTGPTGAFAFTGSLANPNAPVALALADYRVTATINDTNATATANGTFAAGETTSTTDVRILQSGSLTGILRRSTTAPVSDVVVSDTLGRSTVTDSNGRFSFLNYRPGTYSLTASLPPPQGQQGTYLETTRSYTIAAGQLNEADMLFPATGTVDGFVRTASGTPLAGAQVFASLGSGFGRSTSTDAQGRYQLDDLMVGPYQLQAQDPRSSLVKTVTIAIADGVAAHQDLSLTAIGRATITVKLASGLAAVGAGVWIDPAGGDNWQSFRLTDGNGQAVIENVPAGTFSIRASHPLNADLVVLGQATLSQEGQNVLATVTLPPTGIVTGTLRAALGQLLPYTYLEIRDAVTDDVVCEVSSDDKGRFTFTGVPAGRSLWLAVDNYQKWGLRRHGTPFTLSGEGATHDEDISRPAVARVEVKATHPGGSPWTNLAVYAKDSVDTMFSYKGVTDVNGALIVYDVAEGPFTVRLYTASNGLQLAEAQGTVAPADDQGLLHLPIALTAAQGGVSGRIYAADGTTPVPGAIVRILNVDDGKVIRSLTTGSTGDYAFTNVVFSQGGFKVTADSPWDLNLTGTATGTLATDGQTLTRDVIMPVIVGTVFGRVTTTANEPVTDAQVIITTPSASQLPQAFTSDTGGYTIAGYIAPLDGFTVTAVAGGAVQEVHASFNPQPVVEVNISLPIHSVTLTARVLAADHDTAVRSAEIYAVSADGSYLASGFTDGNGRAALGTFLAPLAGFDLQVDYRGEVTATQHVTAFDPATPVDVILPMSVIRGQVTFASGAAVSRPNVFVEDANGVSRQALNTTTTGTYVVFNTAVGPFRITAQDRSSSVRTTVDGVVSAIDVTVVQNIALPQTATVTGRLFDSNGNLLKGEEVDLASESLAFTRWTYTDDNGVYLFSGVPAGSVSLYASPYDDVGQLYVVGGGTVAPPATLTVDLHPVPTARLTGKLVRADGTPEPFGWVDVQSFGGASPNGHFEDTMEPGADGTFSFERVPLGMVKLIGYNQDFDVVGVTTLQFTATTPEVVLTLGTGTETDYTLTGDNGFRFRVTATGALRDGNSPNTPSDSFPFNFTYQPYVNGNYFCCDYEPGLSLSGRQGTLGPLDADLLLHTRKVFVPQSGAFVRFLEIIENPLAIPVKATVEVEASLALDASRTKVVVPADTTGNTYMVLDDSWDGRTPTAPAIAHVMAGQGPVPNKAFLASAPRSGADNYAEYKWIATVPPNSKIVIMHFGVLREAGDAAGATSQAVALVNLSDPEALAGMTAEEKAAVRNFIIAAPGGGGGQ